MPKICSTCGDRYDFSFRFQCSNCCADKIMESEQDSDYEVRTDSGDGYPVYVILDQWED